MRLKGVQRSGSSKKRKLAGLSFIRAITEIPLRFLRGEGVKFQVRGGPQALLFFIRKKPVFFCLKGVESSPEKRRNNKFSIEENEKKGKRCLHKISQILYVLDFL